MKTLHVIQNLSRVGKTLSKVVRICCIVGFCLCVAGIVSLAFAGQSIRVGGVTIRGLIEERTNMSAPVLYVEMGVGALICAVTAVLAGFAEAYFKNELADGTPFTQRGAQELMRLGILTISLTTASALISSIAASAATVYYPEVANRTFGDAASIGTGVMMIVTSLICRHGAELTADSPDAEEPSDPVDPE